MRKFAFRISLLILLTVMVQILPGVHGDPLALPSEPENLHGHPGNGVIYLRWQPPQFGSLTINGYDIYRSSEIDGTDVWDVGKDVLTYEDHDVENGRDYTYRVTALNPVGEGHPSDPVTIRPDGDDPVIRITAPSEDEFLNERAADIKWDGTDSTSCIDHYDIILDEGNWTDVGNAVEYSFSGLAEGMHTVGVRGMDSAGNTGQDTVNFTIDMTAPGLKIISPANDEILNNSNLTIRWRVLENESMINGVGIYLDGFRIAQVIGVDSYNLTSMVDGDHFIGLKAYDVAGNEGMHTVNITVDTEQPVIKIIAPTNGSFSNVSIMYARWEGWDDISGIKGYFMSVDHDAFQALGIVNEEIMGPLGEGEHLIHIKVVDNAGWTSSAEVRVIIDLTPPELSVVVPADGDILQGARLRVVWNSRDILTGVDRSMIRVDEGAWSRIYGNSTELRSLHEGDHLLTVKCTDLAGNMVFKYLTFTIDTSKPLVIDHGPFGSDRPFSNEIWVEFSEKMDPETIRVSVSDMNGTFTIKGERLVWVSNSPFSRGISYHVNVKGNDLAGLPLDPFSWVFSFIDQGTVTGDVRDRDGHPMEGVHVILGSGKTALTDREGGFLINGTMGDKMIYISGEGYIPVSMNITIEPENVKDLGHLYLNRNEIRTGGAKTPQYLLDPWTYSILFLLIIILILATYLFKERLAKVLSILSRFRFFKGRSGS